MYILKYKFAGGETVEIGVMENADEAVEYTRALTDSLIYDGWDVVWNAKDGTISGVEHDKYSVKYWWSKVDVLTLDKLIR